MTARLADLHVGARVRFSPNWCRTHGPVGTVVRVADDPRIVFPAVVEFDHAPEEPRRCTLHELTILPAEDVPPSDDAGGETEGRVERSTEDAPSAPRPSVTIALTPEQERHLRDAPLDRLREGVAIALTPEQSILAHVQLVAADARATLDEVTR